MRINKFLSEAGVCSRREADRRVEAGRVEIDGRVAVPGDQVNEKSVVTVDGKQVEGISKKVIFLLYKPVGYVCTESRREGRTVGELIEYPDRLFSVGRLDKDSEGLLLMTNDGDIVNHIMRARYGHEKEYEVTVNAPVDESFIKGMSEGVPILDTVTRKCGVKRTGERSFNIVLTQGLNRQIRRMCEYFGYDVIRLKRVRIMDLRLGNLKPGEYRRVTEEERKCLIRKSE